mgnify:CR=1 FL=1
MPVGPDRFEELQPAPDVEAAFVTFSRLPHCLFLDSVLRHPRLGRFSFLAADPFDYFEIAAGEGDALATAERRLAGWTAETVPELPPFQGGAAGNSLFWVPALQKYIVVYSGVFSSDVFYRTADRIWGPWSDQTYLFTGLPNSYDDTADYAAMAHPEFAEQNGNVQYIAYVHITGFLQNDIRLVRVTFQAPAP